MTEIRVTHKFFPVGQGLFAAGSIEFLPQPTYRWVYDCGSLTAKRLVTDAIADLKGDCGDSGIDLLTISHFHNDHINDVVDLLNAVGTKTVMLPWAPLWHRLLIGFDQGLRADNPEMRFFIDPVDYLIQEAGDGFRQILFVLPSDGEGPAFPTEPSTVREPPEGIGHPDKLPEPDESVLCDDLDLKNDHSQQRVLRAGQAIPVFGVWEFIPYNDPDTRPSDPTAFEAKVTHRRRELLSGNNYERETALRCLRSLYETTFDRTAMNDVALTLYGGAIYGGAIGWWHGHRHSECCLHDLFD